MNYHAIGNTYQAILILYAVKRYYEQHIVFMEEALRTQPMILYNLSKYLGLTQRYDECIEVCDQGIRIARISGRCLVLADTMYNRGWALIHRGRDGDREAAEISLRHAYFAASAMDQIRTRDATARFFLETYGRELSI